MGLDNSEYELIIDPETSEGERPDFETVFSSQQTIFQFLMCLLLFAVATPIGILFFPLTLVIVLLATSCLLLYTLFAFWKYHCPQCHTECTDWSGYH